MNIKKYTYELDCRSRANMVRYQEAQEALTKAEQAVRDNPETGYYPTTGQMERALQAKVNLLKAKQDLKDAAQAWQNDVDKIKKLRTQLAADLDEAYSANPKAIDAATLELMRSGILTASEYQRLMNQAIDNGNYTMTRLIAQSAAEAAEKLQRKKGAEQDVSQEALQLRSVAYLQPKPADNILQSWDYLVDAMERTANNPAMSGDWDMLTEEVRNNLEGLEV